MNERAYNFSAGPAMLPEAILKEAQAELLNWQQRGLSVLEVGHRTQAFESMLIEAKQDLRDLLSIPEEYHILFLGGAARLQFAMIAMNFITSNQQGGYICSGIWSELAYQEAAKISHAYRIASSAVNEGMYFDIPEPKHWQLKDNTAFVYFTPNETINGVRYRVPPKIDDIPLIADMTSCLLSEPIDIQKYGMIFAGAQKNIANAGLTLVIIHDELLKKIPNNIPTMLDYTTHVMHDSLYSTPPVFNCYLAAKMFKWIKKQGGVSALYKKNHEKAMMLYDYIDSSPFYQCLVKNEARSLMNVCFSLKEPHLQGIWLEQASHQGLIGLKGHRAVGGLRASLYNAMPKEGVETLIMFMNEFAKVHQ